jgi:SAM-dependent methyltransferase
MFPDGRIPEIVHEADLTMRSSYDPWVHRVILQSLLDNQVVIDIGSGNMALDDPCIIRMDVNLSPYVDLVADVHHLPFQAESVDYIFSLAVMEHLRNPFQAAEEMFAALKGGGYIYHECNFVFAYHGYPHHYFNASLQGLEQVFSQYIALRKGVAPYQMPSFAIAMVIQTYLRETQADNYRHGRRLTKLLQQVLAQDLIASDLYFSEKGALSVAAGTYFAGLKPAEQGTGLIPGILQKIWQEDKGFQERFPNIVDLTTVENILIWAKEEGRWQYESIEKYLKELQPFNKRGGDAEWNRQAIREMGFQEPKYGAVGYDPDLPVEQNAQIAEEQYQEKRRQASLQQPSLIKRIWNAQRTRTRRILLREILDEARDWLNK